MSSGCDLSHYYNLVDDIRISEESSTKILDLFQRQYKPTSTIHFYLSSLSFFIFHFSQERLDGLSLMSLKTSFANMEKL